MARTFSPQGQVQMIHGVAVPHGVGELVHHVKPVMRKFSRLVTVATHQGTQSDLPDLLELGQGEFQIGISTFVPKPKKEDCE